MCKVPAPVRSVNGLPDPRDAACDYCAGSGFVVTGQPNVLFCCPECDPHGTARARRTDAPPARRQPTSRNDGFLSHRRQEIHRFARMLARPFEGIAGVIEAAESAVLSAPREAFVVLPQACGEVAHGYELPNRLKQHIRSGVERWRRGRAT